MLDYLRVENFAVVEKVELEFHDGLNVLTGETGAGKSILIDAINCFFKKKVTETAIRGENNRLIVEAMFSHNDDEFVLRREVGRKKSQAYINGKLVPFIQLKERAEGLFTIYGQNEHVFLLNPANHRGFLDEFCQNQQLLSRVSASYGQLKRALNELEALRNTGVKATEMLDFIGFRIAEIEALKMEEGDEEKMEQRLKILSSSEEILSKSGALVRSFYQSDGSLYNTIAESQKSLEFLQEIYPEMVLLNDEVKRFYNLLPEISSSLSHIMSGVEYNEDELNRCHDKLHKLKLLKSKYNTDFDQLLVKLVDLKTEREQLLNMDFSIKDKEKEVERNLEDYKKANLKLRESRQKRAQKLSRLIETELAKLEMSKARFQVQIDECEPELSNISDKGTDKLEFYFSSNPGQNPGRIKEIASGGELSRLMLVLKSILNQELHATYIFDEVDAGIGGKTAEFVGEKLKHISKGNQVICISHLPQIASFADSHFLITKEFKEGETFSYVEALSEESRVDEIGRMMVGSAVNGDVLKAAKNLLEKNKK
ncbi:MAG: DNA repair protein RecN [bacterium]|nr:DNA repair protein RecN [bacterium]